MGRLHFGHFPFTERSGSTKQEGHLALANRPGEKEYCLNLKIHLNRAQRLTAAIMIRAFKNKWDRAKSVSLDFFSFSMNAPAGSKAWAGRRPDVGIEMCCPTVHANEITAAK
jgi:hypothetical protein